MDIMAAEAHVANENSQGSGSAQSTDQTEAAYQLMLAAAKNSQPEVSD